MQRIAQLLLLCLCIFQWACSSTRTRVAGELSLTQELMKEESPEKRRVTNRLFTIQANHIRALEITNHSNGEKKVLELDWPITNIIICPSCPFASLWYTAANGSPYNALLDLTSGEMIEHLGPSEFIWSEKGIFLAMSYPQRVEVIRNDLFENFLEASDDQQRAHLLHRIVEVSPRSGLAASLVGFYEDWVLFIQLGCCGKERTYAVDLEQSQITWIPCQGKEECRDLDDLGELFQRVKRDPKYTAPKDLFRLSP